MKAYLRSTRIAPKKANLVAKMIRGMSAVEAVNTLKLVNKKGARILEGLVKSAIANAEKTAGQLPTDLVVKTVVVNKAQAYHRGVPMARGRVRPMRKFLSHISVTLGVATPEKGSDGSKGTKGKKEEVKESKEAPKTKAPAKKTAKPASQKAKKTVQKKPAASSAKKKSASTAKKSSTSSSTSK